MKGFGALVKNLQSRLRGYGSEEHLETRTIEVSADARIWEFLAFLERVSELMGKPVPKSNINGFVLSLGVRFFIGGETIESVAKEIGNTPIYDVVKLFQRSESVGRFAGL